MKSQFALVVGTAFLANFALAAETTSYEASEKAAASRYAGDRKLCAEEPSSGARMQCLRDAQAEYDKAIKKATNERVNDANACVGCGKVLTVKVVEKDGEGSATGMVAGGVAGALLGNQIGKGTGRSIATLAGAAGGAYAGNKIEQKVNSVKRWEVAVRFENGDEKTFSFDKDPGFSSGAEVRASSGSIIPR